MDLFDPLEALANKSKCAFEAPYDQAVELLMDARGASGGKSLLWAERTSVAHLCNVETPLDMPFLDPKHLECLTVDVVGDSSLMMWRERAREYVNFSADLGYAMAGNSSGWPQITWAANVGSSGWGVLQVLTELGEKVGGDSSHAVIVSWMANEPFSRDKKLLQEMPDSFLATADAIAKAMMHWPIRVLIFGGTADLWKAPSLLDEWLARARSIFLDYDILMVTGQDAWCNAKFAGGDPWHMSNANPNRELFSDYFCKLLRVAGLTQASKQWLARVHTIFHTKTRLTGMSVFERATELYPAPLVLVDVAAMQREIDEELAREHLLPPGRKATARLTEEQFEDEKDDADYEKLRKAEAAYNAVAQSQRGRWEWLTEAELHEMKWERKPHGGCRGPSAKRDIKPPGSTAPSASSGGSPTSTRISASGCASSHVFSAHRTIAARSRRG